MAPLVAQWTSGLDLPIKALAVLGAFAVSSAVAGWLARTVVRMWFRQELKGGPLWTVRMLSGLAGGWLLALLLFGGGGGGLGGPGGSGLGAGKGAGDKDGKASDKQAVSPGKESTAGEGKAGKGKSDAVGGPGELLRIEVLGEAPLRKLTGSGTFEPTRGYRVGGVTGRLLTLDEVKLLIRQRAAAFPPLRRIEIVVYKDSPDFARPQVADLASWAREVKATDGERMRVDFSEPDRYAPVE